jgi:Asp-tRNA(Asn)/Glu-tRNA(Gln) amidotransferase A subunit family amidase
MPAGPQVRLQRLLALQQYDEAQRFIAQCKARMAELYKATPVVWVRRLLLGQPPLGLASTGDASIDAPWTALETTAISIPMLVASRLTLGLQLTADHGRDARVLRTAVRVGHGEMKPCRHKRETS